MPVLVLCLCTFLLYIATVVPCLLALSAVAAAAAVGVDCTVAGGAFVRC